jgi:CheY-like chemotaxis protein
VERAREAGMNDFMEKPVKMKLLAQMLTKYIKRGEV